MIIHNPILTGSLTLNNVNLSTGNLVTTGSNTFVGNQILSGSLTVSGSVSATGTLTAQTLVVQTVTSSVLYSSGSNIFGNNIANTQVMTGSVLITGSVGINQSNPSYSLDVTGTGRFTSTLATGGDITITKSSDTSFTANNTSASGKSYRLVSKDDGKFYIQNTGVADLVTITSAGSVGIGTASPSTPLYVVGAMKCETGLYFNNATTNGAFVWQEAAKALRFATADTERMRITENGNTLMGTTTDNAYRLGVEAAPGGAQIYLTRLGANAAMFMGGSTGAATQFFIQANGSGGVYMTAGATSWTGNSDERLKNITGNIENAIDSLLTLRTVKHTWKSDDTNKEHLALIAQDVEVVFPQVIDKSKINEKDEDETEYLGVRYTEMIPVLVKAIQEQQAQIEELKSQINK